MQPRRELPRLIKVDYLSYYEAARTLLSLPGLVYNLDTPMEIKLHTSQDHQTPLSLQGYPYAGNQRNDATQAQQVLQQD
jgi:hypothetical protein